MTGNEYQKLAMRTAGDGDIKHRIESRCKGLNREHGECIDSVKKCRFQGHPLDARKLMDGRGDVLWYVATTASGLSYGLDEIMQHNIDRIRLRYPDGFDAERSIHREGERGDNGFGSTGK